MLAVGAGTVAYAQQGQDNRDFTPRWRPSAEDISAFGDARIAALHAGLKLSAEQEKNWPLVEAAAARSRQAARRLVRCAR